MYQKNDINAESCICHKGKKLIFLTLDNGELVIGGKEEAEQMIKDLREATGKL